MKNMIIFFNRLVLALCLFYASSNVFAQYEEDDEYWFLDKEEQETTEKEDNFAMVNSADAGKYNKAEQMFNFIYIAHDVTTPIQHLTERLREIYRDAIRYNNAAVFYLSNGTNPIVVRVNMPGDNRNDFDNLLISELQEKNSHDIVADIDVDKIMDIVNRNEITNDNGGLLYNSITFDFYVNQNFWVLQYNETIISTLYFTFNVRKYIDLEKEFYFNVYQNKDDKIDYAEGKPFGNRNADEINKYINLLPY